MAITRAEAHELWTYIADGIFGETINDNFEPTAEWVRCFNFIKEVASKIIEAEANPEVSRGNQILRATCLSGKTLTHEIQLRKIQQLSEDFSPIDADGQCMEWPRGHKNRVRAELIRRTISQFEFMSDDDLRRIFRSLE